MHCSALFRTIPILHQFRTFLHRSAQFPGVPHYSALFHTIPQFRIVLYLVLHQSAPFCIMQNVQNGAKQMVLLWSFHTLRYILF